MYSLTRQLSATKARTGFSLLDNGFNLKSALSKALPTLFSGISRNFSVFRGSGENLKGCSHPYENVPSRVNVVKGNAAVPYAASFKSFIHSSGRKENEEGRHSKSMNFVRGIIEDNGRDMNAISQRPHVETNADIVHIKIIRNNTFVTVTDSKGNKKMGASSGSLNDKGGAKTRYAAEATAEHVGRLARNMGLKSVVMKVKGFTYFKKKRQAIMSWRDGYTNSRSDQNPIVYIEDTTRKAHNGCRLRKQRRV